MGQSTVMNRRRNFFIIGAVILFFSFSQSVEEASGISYGGIGGRPAFPRADNLRTSDIFVQTITPGQSQAEGVIVINNSPATKTLMVYSADATPSTDGGFACKQLAESNKKISDTKKEVGSWVTFGKPQPALTTVADVSLDPDRDGLTNDQETKYGTDPNNRDTDNDGYLDGAEVRFGYNPLGDGLLPVDGSQLVTAVPSADVPKEATTDGNTVIQDSDNDGLNDQEETKYGTDPKVSDTDNDDFGDLQEVTSGYDPLQPMTVTLQPNSNTFIPFTIKAPNEAEVGEHDGCILIQEKKTLTGQETGMVISTRTGLRLAVTVPGDIVRKLEVTELKVARDSKGATIIHPSVKNVGNVSIDADVKVVVTDIFSRVTKEFGGQYPILRGETSSWNYEMPSSFWGGYYKTTLSVTYDANLEAGTGINSGKSQTTISRVVSFWMLPSIAAVIIYALILLLIIALFLILWFRHRRKKWIRRTWLDYIVQRGDSLKGLAKKFDVSWRLLARVNKLEPPYELVPGKSIKVPPAK